MLNAFSVDWVFSFQTQGWSAATTLGLQHHPVCTLKGLRSQMLNAFSVDWVFSFQTQGWSAATTLGYSTTASLYLKGLRSQMLNAFSVDWGFFVPDPGLERSHNPGLQHHRQFVP